MIWTVIVSTMMVMAPPIPCTGPGLEDHACDVAIFQLPELRVVYTVERSSSDVFEHFYNKPDAEDLAEALNEAHLRRTVHHEHFVNEIDPCINLKNGEEIPIRPWITLPASWLILGY